MAIETNKGTPPHPQRGVPQGSTHSMDRALAATLSAAIYTDNVWMIQTLGEPYEQMPLWRSAAVPEGDPAQLARACLIKNTYSHVQGVDIAPQGKSADPMSGLLTDFSYKEGVFYFGDLACAALVERKRDNGSTVVELCFRGTEKETTGQPKADKLNLIGGYFMSAYKNLDGHYERHRLLIDEAVRIVNQRSARGELVELHVSGHSLGGSMAEIFAKKDAQRLSDPSKFFGCTFGSPGSGQEQHLFSMLVAGVARAILTKLGLLTDNARHASSNYAGGSLGSKPLPGTPNLTQYIDPADPVPKLGLLGGYRSIGRVSHSGARDMDADGNFVLHASMMDIGKHSMIQYEARRQSAFSRQFKLDPENAKGMAAFALARQQAGEIHSAAAAWIESPPSIDTLAERADFIVAAAKAGRGMTPSVAPNAQSDRNHMARGVETAGDAMLQAMSVRNASPEALHIVRQAMGSLASFSEPKQSSTPIPEAPGGSILQRLAQRRAAAAQQAIIAPLPTSPRPAKY